MTKAIACFSRFLKIAGSPQESKHVTHILQWIEASKLCDNLNKVVEPYSMMFTEFMGRKKKQLSSNVSAKKSTKNTKTFSFVGGGGGQLFSDLRFSLGALEPNPRFPRGLAVV